MYRIAIVAVIICWPLLCSAADWQVVADTELGQLKMDKASISREGKYTSAVLIYEFKKQQRFNAPPKDVFNKREDEVLVDCSNPLLGLHTSRFFDDEKLVTTSTRKTSDIKFNAAAPDTMAATVIKAVCAASSKTNP